MRKGTPSAGRSWRKKVDRSGFVGSVMFGMLLEGLTRSWRAGRLVQEGRGCQVCRVFMEVGVHRG
jgi:hypothetical protein